MLNKQTEINQLVEHLFRHESGRIVAVLTRIFGPDNLDLAEDVVQDALVEAIRQWTYNGIPENPSGWLFRVAKNKALNVVNREKYKTRYASDIIHLLQSEWTAEPAMAYIFSEKEISDDQLRMMFTCCHPSISSDSQVALMLKTLCGFSIAEIAKAFLTNEDNIHKRLVRARHKIRESHIAFEIPTGEELKQRLRTVLETVYLLFNEGYSASTGVSLVRYEVCEEAIRLTEYLVNHPSIEDKADGYALLALMQLNASRFNARSDAEGNMLTLAQQDRALWDFPVMAKGLVNLENALSGEMLSLYHILALISSCHCSAPTYGSTDWRAILSLYDRLIEMDSSPVVRLNRAVALGMVCGAGAAIAELKPLEGIPAFETYYLFYSVQAEFYKELNQMDEAAGLLKKAIYLAPLNAEKVFLQKKLADCGYFS
jgi:RNA polymerase sigma factor (sigma-70 family)